MGPFISSIVEQISGVGQPQKKFLVTLFVTILLMRGKVNFRNLSRYSNLSEKTYSRQYRQSFNFVEFNERLIEKIIPGHHERIGVMDCSYIPKSGKETYGLGFFYDSRHDQASKGLEISNLAIVDVTDNTGYSLSTWQTPTQPEIEKLIDQVDDPQAGQQSHTRITDELSESRTLDQVADHLGDAEGAVEN